MNCRVHRQAIWNQTEASECVACGKAGCFVPGMCINVCSLDGAGKYISFYGYSQKNLKGSNLGLHEINSYISEYNLNRNFFGGKILQRAF